MSDGAVEAEAADEVFGSGGGKRFSLGETALLLLLSPDDADEATWKCNGDGSCCTDSSSVLSLLCCRCILKSCVAAAALPAASSHCAYLWKGVLGICRI